MSKLEIPVDAGQQLPASPFAGLVTPQVSDPESVAAIRARVKARQGNLSALFAKWDSEPDDPNEPSFEELKKELNDNRRATGERLLFPEPAE